MTFDIFLAMIGFGIVSTTTPGPNNFMLFASGLNYGFKRTIPHILGVSNGFGFLVLCVGLGLGQLLEVFPLAFTTIKIIGALYMVHLAWKIATSGPLEIDEAKSKPLTYLQAALFQWVNPKAWVMAVVIVSTYTNPTSYYTTLTIIVVYFAIANTPMVCVWPGFGMALKQFLSDSKKFRIFNIAMATALLASLWPMLR